MGVARIVFDGNLGKDAEMAETSNGKSYLKCSVPINVGYKDNQRTYWVNVRCFRKGMEGLCQYLTKGTRVIVDGTLEPFDGEQGIVLACTADNIEPVGGKKEGGGQKPSGYQAPKRDSAETRQPTEGGFVEDGKQDPDLSLPF